MSDPKVEAQTTPRAINPMSEMMAVIWAVDAAMRTQGRTGVIACPRCGGEIKYWFGGPRAFRATCAVPGCVSVEG